MKKLLTILLLFNSICSFSQEKKGKYLVYFKDKAGTTFSVSKPEEFLSAKSIQRRKDQKIAVTTTDLPPSKTYIDEIKKAGGQVWYTSRWLNAALVLADSATATKIKTLNFVQGFEANGPLNLSNANSFRKKSKFETVVDTANFGTANNQNRMLGTHNLHNAGFKGKGMTIGILDDGFGDIDKDTYMAKVYSEKRVLGTFDFVRNTKSVYDVGDHGNIVMSTIAANVPGDFVGTAPEANFVLLRSEDASTEKIIEEANYLFACEYADSIGVDVINTSLGYIDFDYAGYDHKKTDFDGKTTLCTKAANFAANAGILMVISAGNSGNSGIGAPADGTEVLAIGAVNASGVKVGFSSVGPSADGRIKPELSAQGSASVVSYYNEASKATVKATSSGTSFSSPIFAGFATCFWQYKKNLNRKEIMAELIKLGNQFNKPDNLLGYGIPKFGQSDIVIILGDELNAKASQWTITPNPASNQITVLGNEINSKTLEINILNYLGQKILTNNFQKGQKKSINVEKLGTGMYFMQILNDKTSEIKKFLIK